MSTSKYMNYINEIDEMKAKGKTNAEIVEFLNKKYDCGATVSSLKSFLKRRRDKKDEEGQKNIEKAVPKDQEENQGKKEVITAEKMEELIINEAQMRVTAKDFSLVTEKYQKAFAFFFVICNEFGEVTEKLRKRAKEKSIYLIFAGIWLLSLLFTMIGSYYIGHCFYKTALLYGMNLLGVPAGFFLGLGIGLAINVKKRKKKAECKKS